MELPPAGWRDDPNDVSQYRYWDGRTWTELRSPKGASPVPTPNATTWPHPSLVDERAKYTSWYKRKLWKLPAWAWVTILVLGLIGAATSNSKKKNDATTAAIVVSSQSTSAPTTIAPGTTATTAPTTVATPTSAPTTPPPTTTATPSTTTTPPATTTDAPAAATVFDGRGDDVIDIRFPIGETTGYVVAVHDGRSNFIVHTISASGSTDGLVNEIGQYAGSSLLDASATQMEVKADGNWHFEIHSLLDATKFDKMTSGRGDQVVVFDGKAGTIAFTHDGQSNFIVHSINKKSSVGLVNEIGAYSGRVRLSSSPAILEIKADGNWTASVT